MQPNRPVPNTHGFLPDPGLNPHDSNHPCYAPPPNACWPTLPVLGIDFDAPLDSLNVYASAAHVASELIASIGVSQLSPLSACPATGRISFAADIPRSLPFHPALLQHFITSILYNELCSPLPDPPKGNPFLRFTLISVPPGTLPPGQQAAAFEIAASATTMPGVANTLTDAFLSISLRHDDCRVLPGCLLPDAAHPLQNFMHYNGSHGTARLAFILASSPKILNRLSTLRRIRDYAARCASRLPHLPRC